MLIKVTIAAPVELELEASELAAAIGQSEADRNTFAPGYASECADRDGARYRVTHGTVSPAFVDLAQAPLAARDWPFDQGLAARAQARVKIGAPAAPDTIAAIIGPEFTEALAKLGLEPAREAILE